VSFGEHREGAADAERVDADELALLVDHERAAAPLRAEE